MMMKIGLVTDSTSDMPVDLTERYQIEVVPAILVMGEQSYIDGEGLSREEFYNRLPAMVDPPTTAAPSVGSFQEKYEKLLRSGVDQILSIHPPAILSGIFNAARLAAESFGTRVHVLDSGQITMGLGFQVLSAAERIARGAFMDEVLDMVEDVRRRISVVALLDTLEYLRRSGRVSWAKAMIGGFLNLKLLIGLHEGIVERLGQTRTYRQGLTNLCEMIRDLGPLERLAILHTNTEERAQQLIAELKPTPLIPYLIVNVTTVIGTHVGPNGLGFVAVRS